MAGREKNGWSLSTIVVKYPYNYKFADFVLYPGLCLTVYYFFILFLTLNHINLYKHQQTDLSFLSLTDRPHFRSPSLMNINLIYSD